MMRWLFLIIVIGISQAQAQTEAQAQAVQFLIHHSFLSSISIHFLSRPKSLSSLHCSRPGQPT